MEEEVQHDRFITSLRGIGDVGGDKERFRALSTVPRTQQYSMPPWQSLEIASKGERELGDAASLPGS